MLPTRVHPWKGTSHEKGIDGPGLSRSHPPSSVAQVWSPETGTDKMVNIYKTFLQWLKDATNDGVT